MNIDSMSSSVTIKVNGEVKIVPQNISILKLLDTYKINKDKVVIELNKAILRKDLYKSIILKEDDHLEIVTFVGGG